MAKEIVWNKRALNELRKLIEYLENDWGVQVTENFITRLDDLLDLIAIYPELGKLAMTNKPIRGSVITKHTTLFYRIDGERLILLSLFDNRQDPKKKRL